MSQHLIKPVYFDTCAYRMIASPKFAYYPKDMPLEDFAKLLQAKEAAVGMDAYASTIATWELVAHLSEDLADGTSGKQKRSDFISCYRACQFMRNHIVKNGEYGYFEFEQSALAKGLAEYGEVEKNDQKVAMYDKNAQILAMFVKNLSDYPQNEQGWRRSDMLKEIVASVREFKDAGNEYICSELKNCTEKTDFIEAVEAAFTYNVLYDCVDNAITLEYARKMHPITYMFLDVKLEGIFKKNREHSDCIRELIYKKKESNSFVDAVLLSELHTKRESVAYTFVTCDGAVKKMKNHLKDTNHRILPLEEYLDELGLNRF